MHFPSHCHAFHLLHHSYHVTCSIPLPVSDLPNSPILISMNIQSIRSVVHRAHVSFAEHPVVFGEVLLCEAGGGVRVSQGFSHELVHPGVGVGGGGCWVGG